MPSLIKVIRSKCLDCCSGQKDAVADCATVSCPLHPFRFGRDFSRKKPKLTPERLRQLSEARAKRQPKNVENING